MRLKITRITWRWLYHPVPEDSWKDFISTWFLWSIRAWWYVIDNAGKLWFWAVFDGKQIWQVRIKKNTSFIVEIPLPSVIHIHKIVWQISKGISSLKSSLCCEQVTAIYPEVRENQIIFFKIQFDFKSFRRPYMI